MKGILCPNCDTINAMPVDNCDHCGSELETANALNFCDFPECDREQAENDIYCRFHKLIRLQALGVSVDEKELETAFMEG